MPTNTRRWRRLCPDRRRGSARLLSLTLMCAVLFGCQSASPPTPIVSDVALGSCSLGIEDGVGDEDAIRAVLNAEGESVVSQDIDALMHLWADDGKVVDAKNTPDNLDDDQTWDGRDAIRHRYVRTVFPGAPSAVQPSDLEIAVDNDQATVTSTTHIGDEVSPAGDRWQFRRVDGCWLIESLTYNLEAKP